MKFRMLPYEVDDEFLRSLGQILAKFRTDLSEV